MAENGQLATSFRQAGAGSPIVFVHGVGMNGAIWQPQIEEFAASHLVIAYDMLGHGASPLPPAIPTLRDYAGQLLGQLDELDLAEASIVGHSMGALVALEFALAHPERTARVVALNAVYRRSPSQRAAVVARAEQLERHGPAETVAGTIGRWFGEPVPPALEDKAAEVVALLAAVDPLGYARTYRLFATADDAHAERLAGLAVPALFMTGALDPNSSPDMSRAMAALAPLGRAEIVPGERHMMSFTAPATVNPRLRAFIEEPPAIAAAAPLQGRTAP